MELLSARHLGWILLTVFCVAGAVRASVLTPRGHRYLRAGLFTLVLLNESAWFAYRHFIAQIPLVQNLPLHLCDISVFALLAGLVTRHRLLAEFSYYAGVVGALLAVCFPAISEQGAIYVVAEIRYFITHIALVAAGFYFTFGRGYFPAYGAVVRSYLAILLYALLITPLNLFLGTNYFFTLKAPKQLAFLHAYPHWLFLLAVAVIFWAVFSLMHLPIRNRRGD